MYMKSLSVRKDKLLTQEAITAWFEYLYKHAPHDVVRTIFISSSPYLFRSLFNIAKLCRYASYLVRSTYFIFSVKVNYVDH